MAPSKELQEALAAVGGRLGQPAENPKLSDELIGFLARQKQREEIGAKLGLASRSETRAYFQKLVRDSAASVRIKNPKKPPIQFSGVDGTSSQSATSEAVEIKADIGEARALLKEMGIDLPKELDKAIELAETAVDCTVAISQGAASGASTGALVTAGACASGIGCIATAAGTAIGTVVGVIAAAWECGLIDLAVEQLVALVESVGELLTDIFDPKPENFLWYIDVAGPALRPNGWTPSSDYDRRFFSAALTGLSPAMKAEAEKAMTTRIAGSKLSGFTGVWLIRRTRELGGGAEEWARVSEILGVKRGPQTRNTQNYDALVKVLENTDSAVRNLMKPVLVGMLVSGGFNSVEAQEKVYGTKAKGLAQARIELSVLRAMLTQLEPGKREMDEQEKLKGGAQYFSADARKKFSGKGGVPPFVGVLAVLGASYVLSSPIPALLGAGAYFLTRKKKKAEPAKMTKEEAVAEIKASGKDPFKGAFK